MPVYAFLIILHNGGKKVIVKILLCQMCGRTFESEALDRDDPNERYQEGIPITCPNCSSPRIEVVRALRRIQPAS